MQPYRPTCGPARTHASSNTSVCFSSIPILVPSKVRYLLTSASVLCFVLFFFSFLLVWFGAWAGARGAVSSIAILLKMVSCLLPARYSNKIPISATPLQRTGSEAAPKPRVSGRSRLLRVPPSKSWKFLEQKRKVKQMYLPTPLPPRRHPNAVVSAERSICSPVIARPSRAHRCHRWCCPRRRSVSQLSGRWGGGGLISYQRDTFFQLWPFRVRLCVMASRIRVEMLAREFCPDAVYSSSSPSSTSHNVRCQNFYF